MTTLKLKTVYTYTGSEVGGFYNKKTLELGSWIIGRGGDYRDEVFVHWAGYWEVSRNGEHYGSFKTKKEAIQYIYNWIRINPQDL